MALCQGFRRFQSDPSHGTHCKDVWIQTSSRSWHVVDGSLSGICTAAFACGPYSSRHTVQAARVLAFASIGAYLADEFRRRHRYVYSAWRSSALGHASTPDRLAMNVLEAIESRASASKLTVPGPTRAHLETIIRAGTRAPDHGRLRPWRFA